MFSWDSPAFSMIQWMLAIWSLVLLPFLNPTWTSESSQFTYLWSLAWRILSITLLVNEMSAIVRLFEHSFTLPFSGFGMKTDLFQFFSLYKATLHRSKIQESFLYLLLFSDMILDKCQCLDPRYYQLFISSSPISFLHILFSLMISRFFNLHLSSSPLTSIHLKLQQSVHSHFSFGQYISGQSPQIHCYIRM